MNSEQITTVTVGILIAIFQFGTWLHSYFDRKRQTEKLLGQPHHFSFEILVSDGQPKTVTAKRVGNLNE